jgi:hypothetical protein
MVSRGFSRIYVLELKDFLASSQNFREDYEVYCDIKDSLEKINKLIEKCVYCGERNHELRDC